MIVIWNQISHNLIEAFNQTIEHKSAQEVLHHSVALYTGSLIKLDVLDFRGLQKSTREGGLQRAYVGPSFF